MARSHSSVEEREKVYNAPVQHLVVHYNSHDTRGLDKVVVRTGEQRRAGGEKRGTREGRGVNDLN